RLLLQFRVTTFSRHSALLLWSLRAVDRPFLRFVRLSNSTIRPLRAEATQADDAAQDVLVRRRRDPNVGMSVPRHSPHLPENNQCSEEDARRARTYADSKELYKARLSPRRSRLRVRKQNTRPRALAAELND